MQYCTHCGNLLPDDAKNFCPHCGTSLTDASPAATRPKKRLTPADAPGGLDRTSFFKTYSNGRRLCIAAAIIGYVCAAGTVVAALTNLVEYINAYALLDAIILLVLSLLIHLLCSRIAACLLLAYALYNTIAMTIMFGTPSGWLGLVAGVLAVIGAFQYAKEWRDYQPRSYETTALFRS